MPEARRRRLERIFTIGEFFAAVSSSNAMTRNEPHSRDCQNREAMMASGWMEPGSCRNLVVLVESVTAPLLIEHQAPVCLELDIDVDLPIPCDPQQAADLITALSKQALSAMPDGGDLTITACQSDAGLELEIADSGIDAERRDRSLPIVAAAIHAELLWHNCPQGGAAVTIVFPGNSSQGRMAA
jgi:signal transduction histidine kinase